MIYSKRFKIGFVVTMIFTFCVGTYSQTSSKEETRFPWASSQKDFIRDWLIIGGFPNQDENGFDTDYLQENSGEEKIQPVNDMTHTRPDGFKFYWKNYESPYNYINFYDILEDVTYSNKVGYAYTKISRQNAGKEILSFGSNVGCKIWVNGKRVYSNKNGNASGENNQIEVDLLMGENSILLKSVNGGWTWGFWMRLIKPENFSLVHEFQLSPEIIKSSDQNKLVIKTDRTLNKEIQKIDVTVKAVAAGGKVVSEKKVKRGEEVVINTQNWKDGIYDICLTSINTKGQVLTAYLYWYKGDAVKAAKDLISSVPNKPETPKDMLHVMLSELIIDRVGKDLSNIDSSKISTLYSPLMEYEESVNNSAVHANGFVRLTYRDETDNTPQFCRAYLPMNYDPDKKWPLVVNLHGYYGANPPYVNWWSIDSRHMDLVDRYPVIDIEPHGRGNTSYTGIGENDVLKCIELAKKMFNVDEDRIYLKGESMGGGGTWRVGTMHTDIFAAIAPVYGGWDYHVNMTEEQISKLTEREKFYNERSSNFAQADAMLTTPIFITHGDIDESVDVNFSRYAVKMLQRWGYDIRYHEYPGFGHEGIPYTDEVISWFLNHKKNNAPKTVRVRSAALNSAKSNWVKVLQRENPFAFIEAEAEVLINNTIRLATENVISVELTPPVALINPKENVTVVWNVNDIREVEVKDGKIILTDKNYKTSAKSKNPEIEGPISEVTTTPFAIVIGTSSKDTLMNKLCRIKATEFVSYWKNWQKYEPRVFLDTELSEIDMAKYSLILYGDAEANLITKKIGNKIPLKISSSNIEISGKVFEAKDACVQMVYPHPLNDKRYVTVIGGTSAAGMYFYTNGEEDFDFFIKDGSVVNRSLGFPSDKLIIARGIFDNNWKISDKYTETGDFDLRKKCPYRRVQSDFTTIIENLPLVDKEILNTYIGKYEIQPGVNINVFIESGNLMGNSPDGQKFKLFPISETDFFIDMADVLLMFKKNNDGIVVGVEIIQNGNKMISRKVK
ncbi:MAG: prolyl oligopeptidase family serine peptidase [Ignavibacteriales bacterium]|nr:prolyl oligopeptidase family serine peptidase [Ignavibacteriales bacterium]